MLSCDCILKEWVFVVIDTKSAKFFKMKGCVAAITGLDPFRGGCVAGVWRLESLKVKSVTAI